MHSRICVSILSLLFFTGACGDDGGTTQGPEVTDGATTEMPATTGEQPTTGETPSTGDTTADPSTSSEGGTTSDGATSDAEPTTGEPATDTGATTDVEPGTTGGGEPDPDIVSACEAYCGRWDECGFQPDPAGCIAGCADNLSGTEDACKDANLAALACKTALECDDLLDAVGDGGPCSAEEMEAAKVCDGAGCGGSFLGENDACELIRECEGEPERKMVCDGDSCVCLEGGRQTGQCAAEGACLDFDAAQQKAAACCGF